MKKRNVALGLLALPIACASPAPEPARAPEPPTEHTAPPENEAPEEPPAPTEEEQRAAAEAEKLAQDRAKMRAEAEVELARFTPELRARAKALTERNYTSLKAGLDALLPSDHRKPGHAARDQYRHPRETLEFFGVKPTSAVLEYSPGEGWYTELLAPLLWRRGELYVTTTDPNGPPEARPTFYAERVKLLLEKSPELFGKVKPVVFDPSAVELDLEGKLDVAIVIRGMHGWVNAQSTDKWLDEIHAALKKNGVLGIVQHRAAADADPKESARRGYLPEAWVIQTIEARGFKLASKSEVNANTKDTRDYPEGVWALPPTLARGDKDREALSAIGESDRMTLRFVRVDK